MPTLADFSNAPTEIHFQGQTYYLRQPDLNEEGTFQRWLENRALLAIETARYPDEAKRERDRQLHWQDVACGVYEAGGVIYAKASMLPTGMAKLIQITQHTDGVALPDPVAKEMVRYRLKELCAILISKVRSDPKVLEAALAQLGLPYDYFSSNWPTRLEEAQKIFQQSLSSVPTNSSVGSMSNDTMTAPPG